ncbi:MAG TPA: hypothetical protein VJS65_00960 [Verrucomicrobiae bacterium]|nr:hypothetical protein [Verrucomicrobiae bacterium]
MKIQHLMALVVLSFPTVPGARAAVRGFKARTLVPGLLILACLLVAAPATAELTYGAVSGHAFVSGNPDASGDIVIASTYLGYPVTFIASSAFPQSNRGRGQRQSGELATHLDQHTARRLRRFCRSRMGESPAPLLSRAVGLNAREKQ